MINYLMVDFNDLEQDKVVLKIITKNCTVWEYCVKSEMKMMQHECTKMIFPSLNKMFGLHYP